MQKTYCGKNCDECKYKADLNCPGCKEGPGDEWNGDCKIAKCCDDKGHNSCDTCNMNDSCWKLRQRHEIPKERIIKNNEEAEKNERIMQKTVILGKWIPLLFIVSIIAVVTNVFQNDTFKISLSSLYYFGEITESICGIISVFALFKMAAVSQSYKTAAWGKLFATAGLFLTIIVFLLTFNAIISLLLAFVLAIITLYTEYCEITGHSEVLEEIDPDLSEKWDKLKKWYIISYISVAAGALLSFIPLLATLILFAASIALIIIGIAKLVLLYATSKVFKSLSQQ